MACQPRIRSAADRRITAVFAVILCMRLGGATIAGWMADRMGRRAPLIISIIWYSVCNFIAGFSPSFAFLFFWRAMLGIGMGAEWPAGAALAMESWPARSQGFMSGVLQGLWALGFVLSSRTYGFLYAPLEAMGKSYGWRGLLIIGGASGTGLRLDPRLRQGTGSLDREQEAADSTWRRSKRCRC
jgi:SHS family lactate transporter-like MFS transporter